MRRTPEFWRSRYALESTNPNRLWSDNFAIGRGSDLRRLLKQTVEKFAARGGSSTVESERELVEVVIQMVWADRSLVRPEQPPLQQRGDAVYAWHGSYRGTRRLPLEPSHPVAVAHRVQAAVAGPPVGMHDAARFNRLLDEAMQITLAGVWNACHADSPCATTVLLRGDHHQGLGLCASSLITAFFASYERFIDFQLSSQTVTPRPNHGSTQLVQPSPCRAITAQTEHTLHGHGTGCAILARHIPTRAKPNGQRQPRPMKNRSGCDRDLPPTPSTQPQTTLHCPSFPTPATRTQEPVRPAKCSQVVVAGLVGGESSL